MGLSQNEDVSGGTSKCAIYTNDGNIKSSWGSVPFAGGTFFTISSNDFSGTYKSSTNTITVKKGGKYQVNDNGNVSIITIPDNGTISIPYKSTPWFMLRI